MKTLIITGSHRKNQATYAAAEKFSKLMQQKVPSEVEICQLAEMNINPCCATSECISSGENRCVRKNDDFNTLFDKMAASDMVLFLVPKYAPYPSKVMALMERMTAISWWGYGQHGKINEFVMAGKPAAMLAFTSVPGIPKEVFFPMFFTFGELGFDVVRFEQIPGLAYCKADGNEDELLAKVADCFKEKISAKSGK